MKYSVNIKKTEEGYAVWVSGLPGCWPQGSTEELALGYQEKKAYNQNPQ
jgi:predicted RNase H-like HicB family nuclease